MRVTLTEGAKGITFKDTLESNKDQVMKDLAVKVSGKTVSKHRLKVNITEKMKGL